MSLPVALVRQAQAEFDRGVEFYENQTVGSGDRFREKVRTILEQIGGMPEMHRVVSGKIRRAVIHGYPYCIDYIVDARRVRVLSVFHTSRNPERWRSRG